MKNPPDGPAAVEEIHQLYCRSTGQQLSLRFDRQRLWHDFLKAGFCAEDLRRVIAYLRKEIRAGHRNIGALKLSNLLQLDRFEEDLNISRVRLNPHRRCQPDASRAPAHESPSEPQRRNIADRLRILRQHLRSL
jgi:hypothetical protein